MEGIRARREIRILFALAWDGEDLVGVLPCAIHRRSGLRVLNWAAQLFSDYCDCLIDRDQDRSAVLQALWEGLNKAGGFDVISLQQVRPDAKCRDFFDAMAQAGGLQYVSRQERCMRIENCWPTGEAFFRSLNKKGRNNHTRGKRILGEMGGEVTFQVIEPGIVVEPILTEILRLKEVWLRETDPTSPLLGDDKVILRAVLDGIWKSGLAKIFLLNCGGKIAAASINFVYADRMEAYLTSYDAAYERASPGTILIVEYSQWSFDRGLRYVDFLRGEEAFKFRMANAETLLSGFSGGSTLVGQVAILGRKWLSRVRQRQHAAKQEPEDAFEAIGSNGFLANCP